MVVTDLREELVAYVNGSPYLRRELEMPSAALHHAGKLLCVVWVYNTLLIQKHTQDAVCAKVKIMCKDLAGNIVCSKTHHTS